MKRFITLNNRLGNGVTLLNPEYIVSIEDLRSDNGCTLKEGYTVVTTNARRYEVKETQEEIINAIAYLS